MTQTKQCSKCLKDRPLTDFWVQSASPDGRQSRCVECAQEAQGEQTAEQRRRYRVKSVYGLSWEDYQTLFAKQKGCCAICKKKRRLVIDHNHADGYVRGLLCNGCNRAIGCFDDDVAILEDAILYLQT